MIPEEGRPPLVPRYAWAGLLQDVLAGCALRAEHAVSARVHLPLALRPCRIFSRHAADQGSDLDSDLWMPNRSRLAAPEAQTAVRCQPTRVTGLTTISPQ